MFIKETEVWKILLRISLKYWWKSFGELAKDERRPQTVIGFCNGGEGHGSPRLL